MNCGAFGRIVALKSTDDIVTSAECSNDDEDLEECNFEHAGGLGQFNSACSYVVVFHFATEDQILKASSPPMD
ncbi:neurexin 3a isoform X1 [Tachysurus ichikawai]